MSFEFAITFTLFPFTCLSQLHPHVFIFFLAPIPALYQLLVLVFFPILVPRPYIITLVSSSADLQIAL